MAGASAELLGAMKLLLIKGCDLASFVGWSPKSSSDRRYTWWSLASGVIYERWSRDYGG